MPSGELSDQDLLRYSRHLLLDSIGPEGQAEFARASVLIIGMGGLGCAAAAYLASSGVKRLVLVDDDVVDWTNLQRQILHEDASIGHAKVGSAAKRLSILAPSLVIQPIRARADLSNMPPLVESCDVVLDCSDNFATRQQVNQVCHDVGRPLVFGAALRFAGQVSVFDPRDLASPCYACMFRPDASWTEERCATMGVFAPLVGIVGTIQAGEALKCLLGLPGLTGKLLLIDALTMQFETIRVARDHDCPVCSSPIKAPIARSTKASPHS